ncbi:hypothetical protein DMB66_52520 [Actinoplanes sp. ATCC 53533]|nr:hypothetical protein DMB66_52520 [Actinoplanes sp. ATCC 53533]
MSEDVTAVVVEWSTDYIAMLADGDPELVSVKHRDPGQGDWQMSELGPVLRDLHHVWREMGERCRCAFASNAAAATRAVKEIGTRLGSYIDAASAELERFRQVLALPDPPLPRRTEITAVGVRDMGGALSLLGRDDRHADRCYRALVDRIAAVATEQPDSPERRIARLTGSLRAVNDRKRVRLADQTLSIADLRDLVLSVEAAPAQAVRRPIRAAATPRRTAYQEAVVGDERFLLRGLVEETDAPDGSYQEQRAAVGPSDGRPRELWLARLEVLRESPAADRRLAEFDDEVQVHETVVGLPPVVARDRFGFVTELPAGSPLLTAYGSPPYPGVALDALLRVLPMMARTLEALHAAGRAHRALRPEVLLASRDRLWLRDAGLAATAVAAGEGPAFYRAPEQDRPLLMPPGPATDVFQVAAVLFHLATGHLAGTNPPPPSLLRPELRSELDTPLLDALVDDPARRPTLALLIEQLSSVLARGGTVRW